MKRLARPLSFVFAAAFLVATLVNASLVGSSRQALARAVTRGSGVGSAGRWLVVAIIPEAGDSFFEPAGSTHLLSENASATVELDSLHRERIFAGLREQRGQGQEKRGEKAQQVHFFVQTSTNLRSKIFDTSQATLPAITTATDSPSSFQPFSCCNTTSHPPSRSTA